MSNVYTQKSNCVRGARSALKNPKAQPGVDFTVVAVDGGGFTWKAKPAADEPKTKASRKKAAAAEPKAPRAPRKAHTGERPTILGQPQAKRAIELCRREGGCTVEAGAAALHVEPHTFRGLISRCNKAGAGITKGKAFRVVTYIAPPAAPLPALAA